MKINHTHHFNLVVNDIFENNLTITQFIGDNPKRALARGCLNHASWYACEYCFSKGVKILTNDDEIAKKKESLLLQKRIISEKIDAIKDLPLTTPAELENLRNIEQELSQLESNLKSKRSNIVWPKETANGPPRTREEMFEIIQKIENDVPMTVDESKGVVSRSILFDLPNFDFFLDVAVDYLHTACLGVIKKCVELTFKVGENRSRITNRPLSSPAQFNLLIRNIKVVQEFNRRVRDLDFAVYKGQEYRNLVLFFFPLILDCIEVGAKERHVWLYLSYMIKSCVIPSEEIQPVPLNVIAECAQKFYETYESLFGPKNCTYNTHVLSSHLLEMRHHGPLTLTSAYPFESFYGEMRQCFVPGTVSTLKQIMSNVLMKRVVANHNCKKDIFISPNNTAMECNNLVYLFKDRQYHIYKVISVEENEYVCVKQKTKKCTFREIPNLNWSLIGVFVANGECNTHETIPKQQIKGKVLNVNNFLITCPLNVLLEK